MNKLKLVALLFVSFCVISLGSCSKDEPASTSSGSSSSSTASKVTSTEKPVITVWAWDSNFNGTAIAEASKIYGDDVTVKFVEMSKADCLKKIHTILASGVTKDLPEIVLISDLAVQGYLMSYPGAFKPMDNIIQYNDFTPYKKGMVSYDGVGYGVPFDTGVAGLFYRKDYIDAIGYSDKIDNLTWDEYLAMGELLKEQGHLLQTYNPNDINEFQIMLQSTGSWYTDENGNADFVDNEALAQSFDIFKGLYDSDFVKTVSDWGEFIGAINGGEVACVVRGAWISSAIMAAEDQSGLWGVAPVPKLTTPGATQRANQGGSSWFVLANSANADVAADFMKETFAGSSDLYNTLLEKNIMGTYLPAMDSPLYDTPQEYYGGQTLNRDLANWAAEIPNVNVGAFTAEAQAALTGILPKLLAGGDYESCMQEAANQFTLLIQ